MNIRTENTGDARIQGDILNNAESGKSMQMKIDKKKIRNKKVREKKNIQMINTLKKY